MAGEDPIRALVSGVAHAGPWGLVRGSRATEEEVRGRCDAAPIDVLEVPGRSRPMRIVRADASVLERAASSVDPRTRRYLGRNARLALAVAHGVLDDAGLTPDRRERTALFAATFRGPWDPEGTRSMLEAAGVGGETGPPRASAALARYRMIRTEVPYLTSMETAVPGQLSAALGLRGPVHALTVPGLAGGAQALARAALAVMRGDAPAALAVGVLTAEDPLGVSEYLEWTGRPEEVVVECAAVVLLERASGSDGGRPSLAPISESFGNPVAPPAGASGSWCGAAGPFLALARRVRNVGRSEALTMRGALGHVFEFVLGAGR